MTVVSLQYLTPLILTFNCTLLLKTLGEKGPGRGRGGARGGRGGARGGAGRAAAGVRAELGGGGGAGDPTWWYVGVGWG